MEKYTYKEEQLVKNDHFILCYKLFILWVQGIGGGGASIVCGDKTMREHSGK